MDDERIRYFVWWDWINSYDCYNMYFNDYLEVIKQFLKDEEETDQILT